MMQEDSLTYLTGKRVVITRAAHQAQNLGRKLEKCGSLILYLPLITIAPSQEARCPENLGAFDWLLLTSINGVQYFDQCLKRAGKSFNDLAHCRVAVIGKATEKALSELGVKVNVLPAKHVSDDLIKAFFMAESNPSGKHILYPKGNLASPEIECALKIRGVTITSIICYETLRRPVSQEETRLLAAFHPDAVTFFSPSAVRSFSDAGLRRLLSHGGHAPVYVSIGPVTTEAINAAQLSPVIEASQQIEDNLLRTLNNYFMENDFKNRN